jgi:hypothetical protein
MEEETKREIEELEDHYRGRPIPDEAAVTLTDKIIKEQEENSPEEE